MSASAGLSCRLCGSDRLLRITTRKKPGPDGEERFSYQATESLRAAPDRLPFRDLSQYAHDCAPATSGHCCSPAPSSSGCSTGSRATAPGSCRDGCGSAVGCAGASLRDFRQDKLTCAKVPVKIGLDRAIAGRLLRFGVPLAASLGVEAVLLNADWSPGSCRSLC
ncbi:MAG: hypothetical protein JO281_05605 [Pseudonocardiales bacterium]|nr:hypothetical protein [Pseudonocardiales bacterium]